MECKLCGKDYTALGNHLRQSHGISPDDYRIEFNIPLSEPLQEAWLSKKLSGLAVKRCEDPQEKERLLAIAAKGRERTKGKKAGKRNLPSCSKEHCHEKNMRKSAAFKEKYLPLVEPDWRAGLCQHVIAKKHGISSHVLKKWMEAGMLPRRERTIIYMVVE